MSRVEPKEQPAKREAKEGRRLPVGGDPDRKQMRTGSAEQTGDETMRIPR